MLFPLATDKTLFRRIIRAVAALCSAALLAAAGGVVSAKFGECDPGYTFNPRSGVGCMQTHCLEIPHAKYSYEGRCICGSSGSETENPLDANKECWFPQTDTSCKGCLAACVGLKEKCPGEFGVGDKQEEAPGAIEKGAYWMVQDAFSKFMSIGADLLEAATDIKVKEDTESDAFYEARVIFPDSKQADVRFFHLNTEASKDKGLAFEFNVFEIKAPDGHSFIDEWSIGIGIGSVSADGGSTDIPNTPISPGINFNNIRRWFSEQYTDVASWWEYNAPWFLGGGEASPIGGTKNR